MKKTKTRIIDILSVTGVCILLVACHPNKGGQEQVIIPNDTIFVASDSSQHLIVHSLIEVYEALNPLRKVIPIYTREKKLYGYIQTDQVDLIFRSYLLTAAEQKDIDTRKLNPKIHPFWSDGLALIAAESFPKDSILEEELVAVLTRHSEAFHIILDNSHTSTYDFLFDQYAIDQQQLNAFAAGAEDSVISAVRQRNDYIGLISSAYFTVDRESLPKGVKLIGLIPKGKKKAEYPFQDQLYTKVYPLARQIYGINVGALDSSGSAFASFIMSERGQRIILKSGLLPAKIPSRTVELVTE
ncbi:MAG: phosphate transporter substrate-binding protein PhoT family [Chitinophagaceae bacterium]|nr:phosphate transporter substrate-binding protein PhoT family [Chitinophagaceae bacterium]